MIEIRDLYKYYGERRAIGPVNAEIRDGEIVGLLGLNGAGKTTTLRVLACDLLPSSGSVTIDGLDVVESSDEVRAVTGYLPDRVPLYDDLRVDEYLAYVARLRRVSAGKVAARVEDVTGRTGLTDMRGQLIGTLSHGFRQRLGIAQALVHEPRFVILDEPISGLDPQQIVEMRGLIRDLGGAHTVLISSHILGEISETCDRLLVIRDGTIVAQGTERELSAELLEGVRIDLSFAGGATQQAITALLSRVEGVELVKPRSVMGEAPGVCAVSVEASRDVRAELAQAAVQGGLQLVELRRTSRELEDVFLKLARPAQPSRQEVRP